MSDPNQQPIIIKKKKGGHGHGHHGGAWKVAYADFVTAMMAFFLLLWLLNVTTEEQKRGIADYFTPSSASDSTSGTNSILGGSSIVSEDKQADDPSDAPPIADPNPADPADKDAWEEERRKQEQEAFDAAQKALEQAMEESPELAKLAEHLIVEQTREGLRIQIIDQEQRSLFPLGSAQVYDYTQVLLGKVGQVISKMPNHVKITGHTDATPYPVGAPYTNWELSSDRANAARRALLQGGMKQGKVAWITGKADQDLLFKEDPSNARNRRISIVLLREDVYQEEIKAGD